MTEILLGILYFLRPLSYGISRISFLGMNFLEVFAIISFSLLILVAIMNSNRLKLSITDTLIIAFMVWCIGAFFVYLDKARLADLAKFLLPLFTYIVVRNSISSRQQFLRLVWLMIVALAGITTVTAGLIAAHKGVFVQDYWTGLFRFTGVYPNPHDLGHSMTFMLMLIVVYLTLWKTTSDKKIPTWRILLIGVTVVLGVYCLYKSYVRTAYLGLVIFFMAYLFLLSKKWFVLAATGFAVLVVGLWSVWALIFHDVVNVFEGTRDVDRIASGRPFIWKHNLEIFKNLTFDRKLAGVGIGNRSHVLGAKNRLDNDNVWNSHNDYLEVFMQTGIVGFLIYMAIQILLLLYIFRLTGPDRYAFLALFAAVSAMNLASNSYLTRVPLGQSLFMVLVFAEATARGQWSRPAQVTGVAEPVNRRRVQTWKIHYGKGSTGAADSTAVDLPK